MFRRKNILKKLTIFESSILNGPMSSNKRFYHENLSQDEINKDFAKRRLILGNQHGFNGKRIIVPMQKNTKCSSLYEDGKYVVIDDRITKNYEDFWNLDIPADILVLPQTIEDTVIAYPVADCPVLIAEDTKNKVAALTHCGAEYINRELPIDLIKSLQQVASTKSEDIFLYMSACASSQNYVYDNFPKWATNKSVWDNHIIKDINGYHIDLRGSIIDLLSKYDIKLHQMMINQHDTITDQNLYSNSATHHGISNKNGRFLVGCFYQGENDKPKTYRLTSK